MDAQCVESDPSVETVMKGAAQMSEFQPDWIIAIGGGSPIDAAKAMWIKYDNGSILEDRSGNRDTLSFST